VVRKRRVKEGGGDSEGDERDGCGGMMRGWG
jgi:hypothetical protein